MTLSAFRRCFLPDYKCRADATDGRTTLRFPEKRRRLGANRTLGITSQALNFARHLERGILRGYLRRMGCAGLGAQGVQALHSENLFLKNDAELACGLISDGFEH